LVAMVQFATLWRVVILDPRIAKFHYPRRNFLSGFFFLPESWCGESCDNELFSCSFISSISLCILSICSFAWLSFSSFSEAFFLLPSGSRIFLSFWSCCIFCYTISSYLSTVWSSFSWASSSQLLL
jgi:hypothetical protein